MKVKINNYTRTDDVYTFDINVIDKRSNLHLPVYLYDNSGDDDKTIINDFDMVSAYHEVMINTFLKRHLALMEEKIHTFEMKKYKQIFDIEVLNISKKGNTFSFKLKIINYSVDQVDLKNKLILSNCSLNLKKNEFFYPVGKGVKVYLNRHLNNYLKRELFKFFTNYEQGVIEDAIY